MATDWLNVTPTSGTGDMSVSVLSDINPNEERNMWMVVTAGNIVKRININQLSGYPSNIIIYKADAKLPNATGDNSGLHTSAFVPSITSHTFSNGIGILGFSSDVRQVKEKAFYGCSGVTFVSLPNSINTLGDRCFSNCTYLEKINIPSGITSWGEVLFSRHFPPSATTNTILPTLNITVPHGVTDIGTTGKQSFYGSVCTKIILPDTVTTIHTSSGIGNGAIDVKIPDSVVTIEDSSYIAGSNTISLQLSKNLSEIPQHFLSSTQAGLTSIKYNGTIDEWNSIPKQDGWRGYQRYVECTDGEVNISRPANNVIKYYASSKQNIDLTAFTPATVESAHTHSVGTGTIVFPSDVIVIHNNAFSNVKMSQLILPGSITTIESNAFNTTDNSKGIGIIWLPENLENIGNGALSGDTLIGQGIPPFLKIPDKVKNIPDNFFYYERNVIDCIYLPKELSSIGSKAFYCTRGVGNFVYPGTLAEFDNITKASDWINTNISANQCLSCIDGSKLLTSTYS